MGIMSATYSPDDNKLRLYSLSRLDAETYARVRAAGFRWAPRQELFVAPMWTPAREDLLLELAGEIEDEDKTLTERAEERAERFEEYSDKREADAESARQAVSAIADNIPLGQPILVGHHSERHARKDAERIENGMRKAIKMWETSKYWSARAEGAIRHAKYKELPTVRHRRIKTLESEKRKMERHKAEAQKYLALWTAATDEQAIALANGSYDYETWDKLQKGEITPAQVRELKLEAYPRSIAGIDRWIAHYENRLLYERTMLGEQLGTEGGMAGRFDLKPGGKVLVSRTGEWLVILRVNKVGGEVNSITTTPPAGVTWSSRWKYGVEQIKEYEPPTEARAAAVKKATSLPPLCNYPGEGFKEMTEAEWKGRRKWSDFPYIATLKATETAGRHRRRQMPIGMMKSQPVFITDAKRVDPPKPEQNITGNITEAPAPQPMVGHAAPRPAKNPRDADFEAMRTSLKGGVKVVTAPQLFPTPPDLARRVVALAEIEVGHRVLEPSAGTGALLLEVPGDTCRVAVEINPTLASATRLHQLADVRCADFLECNGDLGTFDRIVMNPPFERGADIRHIEHARKFLRPGGRLVAICANGPRQQEKLKPLATEWEELPPDTFRGTGVRAALLVIQA